MTTNHDQMEELLDIITNRPDEIPTTCLSNFQLKGACVVSKYGEVIKINGTASDLLSKLLYIASQSIGDEIHVTQGYLRKAMHCVRQTVGRAAKKLQEAGLIDITYTYSHVGDRIKKQATYHINYQECLSYFGMDFIRLCGQKKRSFLASKIRKTANLPVVTNCNIKDNFLNKEGGEISAVNQLGVTNLGASIPLPNKCNIKEKSSTSVAIAPSVLPKEKENFKGFVQKGIQTVRENPYINQAARMLSQAFAVQKGVADIESDGTIVNSCFRLRSGMTMTDAHRQVARNHGVHESKIERSFNRFVDYYTNRVDGYYSADEWRTKWDQWAYKDAQPFTKAAALSASPGARDGEVTAEPIVTSFDTCSVSTKDIQMMLHSRLGDPAYRSWIQKGTLEKLNDGSYLITYPNTFLRDRVRQDPRFQGIFDELNIRVSDDARFGAREAPSF